jgi:serine/threonine protein phosphatase PrpC
MRLADPLALKARGTATGIISAGTTVWREDSFAYTASAAFRDECIVVTDGIVTTPHAAIAAQLAADTALWGYKHIRRRPFYWTNKDLLVRRIFRSVNMTLWQKHKESLFASGVFSSMAVAIISAQKVWIGTTGTCRVLLYREGLIDVLTSPDVDDDGHITSALGMRRLGLVPQMSIETLVPGDMLLLLTDSVFQTLSEDQIRAACEVSGDTVDSLTTAVVHVVSTAHEIDATKSMTAYGVKKIAPFLI